MLNPIDIAIEVHKICEEELIPRGISLPHNIEAHSKTSPIYAQGINDAGGLDHITGQQATEAIIEAAGWDKRSPWPGHPSVEKVIERLRDKHGLQTDT